ncbi:DUF5673 domain-containing protein [Haliovirga abyssi]|uniref:DUF5673 domain-containing protein n=1 Tax=Haliovirga abyssi TaxID=2996794 RepID=UPI0027DD0808|nr:DUF5673 domain-containing protein [Haliovirga abyssi]
MKISFTYFINHFSILNLIPLTIIQRNKNSSIIINDKGIYLPEIFIKMEDIKEYNIKNSKLEIKLLNSREKYYVNILRKNEKEVENILNDFICKK